MPDSNTGMSHPYTKPNTGLSNSNTCCLPNTGLPYTDGAALSGIEMRGRISNKQIDKETSREVAEENGKTEGGVETPCEGYGGEFLHRGGRTCSARVFLFAPHGHNCHTVRRDTG